MNLYLLQIISRHKKQELENAEKAVRDAQVGTNLNCQKSLVIIDIDMFHCFRPSTTH